MENRNGFYFGICFRRCDFDPDMMFLWYFSFLFGCAFFAHWIASANSKYSTLVFNQNHNFRITKVGQRAAVRPWKWSPTVWNSGSSNDSQRRGSRTHDAIKPSPGGGVQADFVIISRSVIKLFKLNHYILEYDILDCGFHFWIHFLFFNRKYFL